MFRLNLVLLLFLLIAGSSAAQPMNGNLILSFIQRNNQNQISGGFTARFNPSTPTSWTTIATAPASYWHEWTRMAPNNTDLVIAQCYSLGYQAHLVNSDPGGRVSTISPALPVQLSGFELDHDDCWIAAGGSWASNQLFGIQHTSATAQTFLTLPGQSPGSFNEVAIDRDPGGPTYAIAVYNSTTVTISSTKILHADRSGVTATLAWAGNPLLELSGIELHPRTGDYVTTDFATLPNSVGVNRVTKAGTVIPLYPFASANALRIDPQDTAWILGYQGNMPTVLRYDLTNNSVVTFIQLTNLPPRAAATCIEIYGSRSLVCNQTSRTSVKVNVQSRVPSAAGRSYALAASFARRPGLEMPNKEWLHLDTTGPLFLLSALNLLPSSIFQNFRGTLDPFGNATADVTIPPPLAGTGIPIFMAGVIYDSTGVIQVTNTHWFVL
jgi:hypothetical protein